MSLRIVPCIAAAFCFASALCAQTGPTGHWEGILKAPDREVTLTLDLARNAKSEWIASMGAPADNATGLVVKDLVVNGNSVKFMAVELQMAQLDLTLAGGKLAGTFNSPRGPLPIEFQRTGEANVQLPAPSPAVSKGLEGDWTGTLQAPAPEWELTLHFKNQPDNTVLATIDVPARNAIEMPINDVKQTGDKVEFGLKIAHASFQGTLNQERTELTGQLTHEDQPMHVTFKKK